MHADATVIAGLLLASGQSRRFGSNKLLTPLAGRPVIRWSAEALASAVDIVLVVVPDRSLEMDDALAGVGAQWVVNARAHTGMASSLGAGIAALPPSTEAVVIALGDQPLTDASVVRSLTARWRAGGVRAVAPQYSDGRGHPVLFDASCFESLLALHGDRGARTVLDSLGDAVAIVPVATPQPVDVDTPDALRAVSDALVRSQHGR